MTSTRPQMALAHSLILLEADSTMTGVLPGGSVRSGISWPHNTRTLGANPNLPKKWRARSRTSQLRKLAWPRWLIYICLDDALARPSTVDRRRFGVQSAPAPSLCGARSHQSPFGPTGGRHDVRAAARRYEQPL